MTAQLDWLSRRQRDGGIDQVALPEGVAGSLWLCGKHAVAPQFATVDYSVSSRWLTVVCLTERHELAERYPGYVSWLDRAESAAVWWPIPDMHAPSPAEMTSLVDGLIDRLARGETVLVHCAAGIGRAGTTAACVLVRLGATTDDALRTVAASRPMAGPEVGAQRDLVEALAAATDSSES